jgi:hypothetical protein
MDAAEISRRFDYHANSRIDHADEHAGVRAGCKRLATELDSVVPEGREKALAMTHLEDVMMWASAGIARQGD